MKLQVILPAVLLILSGTAHGFAPVGGRFGTRVVVATPRTTARPFGLDPSSFQDLSQHVDSFRDVFTSLTLSDLDPSAMMDAAPAALDAATRAAIDAAAPAATDAAATAVSSDGGWFGFLTGPIEGLLVLIHSGMVAMGVSSNAWGISIILLTIIVKAVTFPLTKTQLESTNKMQALQPTIKEIQAKYQSNPEVMNQKVAEIYQTNDVNPLAGCLPSLAQIPVFIGLYRAVLNLAAEDRLNEPFLFLPSLEGPTYGADPTHGSDWILSGWQNGSPSMGWENTIPFLILPIFLVISQFISMQIMQPKQSEDPQQQQANAILKVLPLMIGWFSLNVPSALCIYWVVNNIVTTATTVLIRNSMPANVIVDASGAVSAPPPPPSSPFAPPPMRDRPAGFGSALIEDGEVKPLTPVKPPITPVKPPTQVKPLTPIDAEVVVDVKIEDKPNEVPATGMGSTSSSNKKKGGKKKKKRKN